MAVFQSLLELQQRRRKKQLNIQKHAEAHGADCALIINSYYCKPKEEEIYFHFKEISNSVNIPIMLYNNPFTSGVDMSTKLMLRIGKECENVTHIKESSGDIRKARDLVRQSEGAFQVFCGSEDLVMESYLVGASGWVSVAGNIVPGLVTKMYEHFQNGELEKAWEINDAILPLCEFLEGSGKYVQIVKRSMELHGQAGGPSRYPRLGLTVDEDQKLQTILSNIAGSCSCLNKEENIMLKTNIELKPKVEAFLNEEIKMFINGEFVAAIGERRLKRIIQLQKMF